MSRPELAIISLLLFALAIAGIALGIVTDWAELIIVGVLLSGLGGAFAIAAADRKQR